LSGIGKPLIEIFSNDVQLNLVLVIIHLMDNLVRKDRASQRFLVFSFCWKLPTWMLMKAIEKMQRK